MSIIKCPECGHDVSEYSSACPKCGFPIASGKKTSVEQTKAKKHSMSQRLTTPIISFHIRTFRNSINTLQIISFLCLSCVCVLLFPEITYNRVNFEISTTEINQVIGESFLYVAEGVFEFLPYILVISGFFSLFLSVFGSKMKLLWSLSTVVFSSIIVWTVVGAANIQEISTNRRFCAIYVRNGFTTLLVILVICSVVFSVFNYIMLRNYADNKG